MTNGILAIALVAMLAGCEGGDGTISGTDADGNGVRDDVDAYVSSTYADAPQRAAALQLAKGIQAALLVDTTDSAAVRGVTARLSRATHCVYARFDGSGSRQPAAVIQELQAISTNTEQRLRVYLAYNKAMDGTSWAMPEGDGCE